MSIIGNLGPALTINLDSMVKATAEARKLVARAAAMLLEQRLNPTDLLAESRLMQSTNRAERRAMRRAK